MSGAEGTQGWWQREVTTLAFLWRIARSDGVTLGFTTHDRDLEREGLRYRAAPGLLPSAIRLSAGLDPDDVELAGALSADAITAEDLRAGRWDGARLTLTAIDWADPAAAPLPVIRGVLGAVALGEAGFSASLRGIATLLEAPVAPETSPGCRAMLGDRDCRVNLRGRRVTVRVAGGARTAR